MSNINIEMDSALRSEGWTWCLGEEAKYAFSPQTGSRISGEATEDFLVARANKILEQFKTKVKLSDIEQFLEEKGYNMQGSSYLIATDSKGNSYEGDCLIWLLEVLDFANTEQIELLRNDFS